MLKPLIVIAIILILVLFVSDALLGQFSTLRLISSKGTVKVIGVGVYWDANCTYSVYSLDWGMVEPGSTRNTTVYIRNEGNEQSSLFLNATNWNPANASDYIALSWDYNGQLLNPQVAIEVTLTLSISPVA